MSVLEYKTKSENKNKTDECRYSLESNFVGVNGLFVQTYTNQDDNAKRYKGSRYYLPKGVIKNYNVIIIEKDFYDQSIVSDVKQNKQIRKLISQCEDYTIGCLLNYDYTKNHYKLTEVNLSRQKDAYSIAIQKIEFVKQFKNTDGNNADGAKSMLNEFKIKDCC